MVCDRTVRSKRVIELGIRRVRWRSSAAGAAEFGRERLRLAPKCRGTRIYTLRPVGVMPPHIGVSTSSYPDVRPQRGPSGL